MTRDDDAARRFSDLYRCHYAGITAVCARRLGSTQAGEDAAHEVFRIAWQRAPAEDPTVAWLYATARNVVGNEYRRSARAHAAQVRLGLEVDGTVEDACADLDLLAAIDRLRQADRDLLYLAYWEDLTAREIGCLLGTSPGAVWVRLSRAREALRRLLDEPTAGSRQQRD